MKRFTLEEYMEGREPPVKKIEDITYYYGVYLNNSNKLCHFVCRDKNKIPENGSILLCKSIKAAGPAVVKEAKHLLDQFRLEQQETPKFLFENGDVVIHADGLGEHTAIILSKKIQVSEVLFVTSNPYWHPSSRKITQEENTLLGYPIKKTSYFVKVIRNNQHMVATGKSFPDYRILDLIKEFEEKL